LCIFQLNIFNQQRLWAREKERKKVFVILSLSPKPQFITIKDKTLFGNAYNVFKGTKEPVPSKELTMQPWGYAVYEYN